MRRRCLHDGLENAIDINGRVNNRYILWTTELYGAKRGAQSNRCVGNKVAHWMSTEESLLWKLVRVVNNGTTITLKLHRGRSQRWLNRFNWRCRVLVHGVFGQVLSRLERPWGASAQRDSTIKVESLVVSNRGYCVVGFVVHYRNLCTCLACVRAVILLSPVAKLCT